MGTGTGLLLVKEPMFAPSTGSGTGLSKVKGLMLFAPLVVAGSEVQFAHSIAKTLIQL